MIFNYAFNIYTYGLQLKVFKSLHKNLFYVLMYNKKYSILLRTNQTGCDRSNSLVLKNDFFLDFKTDFKCNVEVQKYGKLVNFVIKQFVMYSIKKIKFLGKGYKLKKISTHSINFVFNRSHKTIIFFKNNFFKKIKKKKIHIKYIGYDVHNKIQQIISIQH